MKVIHVIVTYKSKLGYCTFSTSTLGKVKVKNNTSSGYIEGSQVFFYCHVNGDEPVVAACTCMKNGSWSPDPHMYKCQYSEEKDIIASIIIFIPRFSSLISSSSCR